MFVVNVFFHVTVMQAHISHEGQKALLLIQLWILTQVEWLQMQGVLVSPLNNNLSYHGLLDGRLHIPNAGRHTCLLEGGACRTNPPF